jgi:two-component system sensor histidine kinase YesM
MLVGFLFVMIIVLILVGIITFHSVSTLLKDKAEKQIKQTAIQANGRMEALIRQIDTLTTQAVNDAFLQQLLLSEVNGKPANFDQRQALMQIANKIQAYTSGVTSVEVYTREYERLYPLDDQNLYSRVENVWIQKADSEKGRLVWIGTDPKDQDSVLAIRRINLIDRWFSNGGYLLIRLKRNYFEFQESLQEDKPKEIMLLVDSASRPIIAGGENLDINELMRTETQTVTIHKQHYILVKQP